MRKKLCLLVVLLMIFQSLGSVVFALEVSPPWDLDLGKIPENELLDDIVIMDAPLNPEYSEYREEPVFSKGLEQDEFQGATGLMVSPAYINTNYDIIGNYRMMTRSTLRHLTLGVITE